MLAVDIGVAQKRCSTSPGQLSRLIVCDQPPGEAAPPLASVAGDALRLVPEGEEEADLARLTRSFHLNLTAFGLLAFLVGLLHRSRAFGLAFEQRLSMVRTMRAPACPRARSPPRCFAK